MTISRFNPDKAFSDQTWLVHLVNTNNSLGKYVNGGHAALFVEGQGANGNTILRRYDISAASGLKTVCGNTSASTSPFPEEDQLSSHDDVSSLVHNIRVIEIKITQETEEETYYQKICGRNVKVPKKGKKIFSSIDTFTITEEQANSLHKRAQDELAKLVKGIAGSFLQGKKRGGYDFFVRTEELLNVKKKDEEGNEVLYFSDPQDPKKSPLHVFLDIYCFFFWSSPDFLRREMTAFMKLISSGAMERFYLANLKKLSIHNSVLTLVPHFNYFGPYKAALHYSEDSTANSSIDSADKPVNCMYWCRIMLEAIGIDIKRRTNNPKSIGIGGISLFTPPPSPSSSSASGDDLDDLDIENGSSTLKFRCSLQ